MELAHLVDFILFVNAVVVGAERSLIGQVPLRLVQPCQTVCHPSQQVLFLCQRLLQGRLPVRERASIRLGSGP